MASRSTVPVVSALGLRTSRKLNLLSIPLTGPKAAIDYSYTSQKSMSTAPKAVVMAEHEEMTFDVSGTLRRLGGDSHLLADLIRFYDEDSVNLLSELKSSVAADSGEKIHRAAQCPQGIGGQYRRLGTVSKTASTRRRGRAASACRSIADHETGATENVRFRCCS